MFKSVIIFVVLLGVSISSASQRDTILVASGLGVDIRSAKIDAIRNSVKKGVGIYVESKVVVANMMLVKDAILDFSNGFVERYKVLRVEKRQDGLFEYEIEALIKRDKIYRVLDSLKIVKREVHGGSLFASAITQLDRQQKVGQLVSNALEGFPQKAIKIFIGEPVVDRVSSNTATVSFPVNVKWNNRWLDQLHQRLSKATENKEDGMPYLDMGERTKKILDKRCPTPCGIIGMRETPLDDVLPNGRIRWERTSYSAWFFTEEEAREVIMSFGKAKHASHGAFQSANDFSIRIKLLENGRVIKEVPGSLQGNTVQLWKLSGSRLSISQPIYPRGTVLNHVVVDIPMDILERVTSIEAVPVLFN